MIPVSDAFLCALRGSHEAVFRATFLNTYQTGALPTGIQGDIIGGSVRLDGTADERGALDLTVPGHCGEWPDNQFENLAPFGQEVFIERGVGGVGAPQVVGGLPAGIIVGWPSTAASIPAGWSRVTQMDDSFPKGIPNGLTEPGTTGGASTHTHDPASHTHTIGTHTHGAGSATGPSDFFARNGAAVSVASQAHAHLGSSSASTDNTGSTDPAVDAASNLPSYEDVIWIQSDGTTDGIPDGAIAWFDETSVPSGWTQHAAGNGRYVKGAAAGADGGGTGGANTHTHTSPDHTHTTTHSHPATASGAANSATNYVAGALATATGTHTHQITLASTASGGSTTGQLAFSTDSNEPPYYTLALAENTSGGELGTSGLIAVWLGSVADIPDGWALCDGSNGTPDLTAKFIKNATTPATDVGDTGGSLTHSHTGTDHSHAVPTAHTHTRSYGGPSATVNAGATGGSNNSTSGTHTHASHNSSQASGGSTTTGNAAPDADLATGVQPPFIEVAFIMLVEAISGPTVTECAAEYVPLGYFRIETVEQDDAPRSPIRITGRDRMAAIIEARMLEPVTFAAGTEFGDIFETLVLEVYPGAVLVIDDEVTGSTLREPATVEEDRYGFLRDLAQSRGRIMYFDREGRFVVTTAPDVATPVWTVNEGPDGVLVNLRRQLSRSGVYNAVVARGTEADEAGGDPPGYAAVWDDNPNSATYFFGLFGKVPRFYASPFIQTDAQAASAAASILSQTTGLPYTLDISAIPNPALEPLDAITVAFERTEPEGCPGEADEEIHVIDSLTIPLSVDGAMMLNTRSQVQFIAGQVEGA